MTTINPASTATGGNSVSSALDKTEIASNFTMQLLTTQLRNQNPLDPRDTNQFTQQLVQFAQVEQQMKSNDQLASLVALEKSAQATTALAYVGATVVVDGATAQLAGGSASWNLNVSKPSTATITIKDSIGQNVYTGTIAVNPGTQNFTWNGRGNDGDSGPTAATPSRRQQAVGRHFNRGAGDRGFGRSHAGSVPAVDQRPELHTRQDQAHRSTDEVTARGQPWRYGLKGSKFLSEPFR